MKKFYFAFLFTLIFFSVNAQQQPFVTTWEATSSDSFITISTTGTGYNYTVDFGDGTVQNNVTGDASHYYLSPGIYTVSISGTFPRILVKNYDRFQLLSVEQWGDIQWQSMEDAFRGCASLVVNAVDAPDLSQVTDISWMFSGTSINQPINHWDVSNVTDMSWMFVDAISFNQPLNNWDVSNVTDMGFMFSGARSFNQPLNNWNVSSVTDMSYMFRRAENFNQPVNNWDVSNVTDMSFMFAGAFNFNQLLDNWDVSNVTDMNSMFSMDLIDRQTSFNQSLNNWNVSNVVNMSYMFKGASVFNQPLNNWNVSNVTDMSFMFQDACSFNQPLNNWDVSNVVNMKGMFSTNNYNQPLNNWDVSSVTNMAEMFYGASNFNQPLNNWSVSNVTDMSFMFAGDTYGRPSPFNHPLNNWNVSNVTNMQGMFLAAIGFDQPLDNWDVSNVTNMNFMFADATIFNQPLNSWNVSNVTTMKSMFEKAEKFNQPLSNWNVSNVINVSSMFIYANSFNQDLSNWNFNTNVDLSGFLTHCGIGTSNYDLLLAQIDNLNLQNKNLGAEGMLYCNNIIHDNLISSGWTITGDALLVNCNQTLPTGAFVTRWEVKTGDLDIEIPVWSSLTYNYNIDFGDGTVQNNVTGDATHTYSSPGVYVVSILGSFPRIVLDGSLYNEKIRSVEQWGNIQWTSMESAFSRCSNLVINATDAPDLSQVTSMAYMFNEAESFNQSINHWDVSNVTNMNGMFRKAKNFNQSLDNWNVSNVTDMGFMFFDASSFNQTLDNWNVSSVTNMSYMFYQALSFNQLINNWNVSNVTNMKRMFSGALSFNKALNNWDVSNVTAMSYMFSDARYFNQPLNNWDVSNVSNMEGMFGKGAYAIQDTFFNQPLGNWNVSNVTNMMYMFDNAIHFNQPLNNWDVSNVTDMRGMFRGAKKFNQPLDNWDVSNIINMSGMFNGTSDFDRSLNSWNVSNVMDMSLMFYDATSFNQPLDNWNVSNVSDMSFMFEEASSFNQPLDNWDVSNVVEMIGIFVNASDFNQNLSNWNFNQTVSLSHYSIFSSTGFVSHSGLDVNNYEALLSHLASLGLDENELGADGLEYCNQGAHNYLTNNLGWTIIGDNLSSDCNIITGTVLYDKNSNGCDPSDLGANGLMVNIDDGTYDFTTFSNNGNYSTGVAGTNFTVSAINIPAYYTVTPPSTTVTFTTSDTEQQDFCVTANQNVEDLNITLLPTSQARPGFEADYQLVVENMGTQSVATVTLTLSFDGTKQSYVSAAPSPTSINANQFTFDLTNLLPFETRTIDIKMQTFTPPTVNGDDILDFTAIVTPNTNDNTPVDNTFNLAQTVVNSFDPNDKQVLQGEEISLSQADEYLDYLIRFQNTGTASAINVRILDTLHPKLDYSTIKPVSTSHNYHVEITDGNHVEFIFENINLPHEAANEPGSHGFIAYKIKPKSDVQIGDIITGDAYIYFDFNAPIITNKVSTEIVENLSTENIELNKIRLYPNPTNGILNISSETELEKVELFSITGNPLLLQENSLEKIDLHRFSEGVYFLKIIGENGAEVVEKIVKK